MKRIVSFLDRGLQFSSRHEAGRFTSARKCQIRGQIGGQIRGKFPLSRLSPGKRQYPCDLDEGFQFRFLSPRGPISSFLLPVISTKGSEKSQISFYPMCFARKLRFLSPRKAIEFPFFFTTYKQFICPVQNASMEQLYKNHHEE